MSQPDTELYSRLGNIEAKVDILLSRSTGYEKRLSKLERFEARVAGIALVVSIVISYIFKKAL